MRVGKKECRFEEKRKERKKEQEKKREKMETMGSEWAKGS